MKKKLTQEQKNDAIRLKSIYERKKNTLAINHEKLAEIIGITQGAVSHILNGRNTLNVQTASAFANLLKVKVDDFSPSLSNEIRMLSLSINANSISTGFVGYNFKNAKFPLISWVSAGIWNEAIDPYSIKDIDKWSETTKEASCNSFWLKVKDDSMNSPVGLSIPEGMLILVDPDKEPSTGSLVIAKLAKDNEATFKKLVIDAGQAFLKPLNPRYPLITINDDCKIIGVVIEAKWDRL